MASRRRSLALVALLLFLGIVVGTVLGEAIGLILPEGKVVRDVFVNSVEYHVGPVHVDLVVFSFTFAFSLRGKQGRLARDPTESYDVHEKFPDDFARLEALRAAWALELEANPRGWIQR